MAFNIRSRKLLLLVVIIICVGCAAIVNMDLNKRYGETTPTNRATALISAIDAAKDDIYHAEVKPIIEARCVVCHACYDSPCQLNMSSIAGIERGAHKDLVYNAARFNAAEPNRLFIDAFTISDWRQRGFFPALNERKQNVEANTQASLLARVLMQKQQHPLPDDTILSDQFDFSLDRAQQCATIEEFDSFENKQPLAGMPYGLPALAPGEHKVLIEWLANGAIMTAEPTLAADQLAAITKLETWLNADNLKMQLSARYIYEHLFTSHLYFESLVKNQQQPQFYNLVRSKTAPGQTLDIVARRRPYDDPEVSRVYYRLQPVVATIVNKTHQPYPINQDLLDKWQQWFVDADYDVTELPSYIPEVAANPLTAFMQLPVNARYRFMLERAENTIMGYIKGPVCRGQVALNVINDHFWVYFFDPDLINNEKIEDFYLAQKDNLRLPAENESSARAINWPGYAKRQGDYLRARSDFLNTALKDGQHLTPDALWDGDGNNQNASLTVFRHFDNATVVKGLIGDPPKTAWVIDYVLLERIHYLLVAGFDVYGNYGHQLMTRLYMDFLRMEGESNFLAYLPPQVRKNEFKDWYQNAGTELTKFIEGDINPFSQPSGIEFKTDQQKAELYQLFAKEVDKVQPQLHQLDNSLLSQNSTALLNQLGKIKGQAASILPEMTMIMVQPTDTNLEPELFTLLRNSAHYNVNSLFSEADNRDYANDNMTIVYGLLGSYPNVFWQVAEADLAKVVAAAEQLSTEQDYAQLLNNVAVRRTATDFWQFSDQLNGIFNQLNPIDSGLLDYNRLDNR